MANKEATLLLRIKSAGEDALDRVGLSFGKIWKVGLATFAAIGFAVKESIENYREQEEATNALSRAMINQGIYTKTLKDEYLAQATALQKLTTFGDEQIIGAQGILQGYLGQTKVSKELTQATLDLAAAKKMDLASAAELVGKSIGTSTNALSRYGVEINATASKQEKLGQFIEGVNSKWKDQAAAAASGLGFIKQLQNTFSDILETVGQRLVPVLELFGGKLRSISADTTVVNSLVDAFIGTLHLLTQVGNVVGGIFEGIAQILSGTLAVAVEGISALIKGNFSQAFDIAKTGGKELGASLTDTYKNTATRMKEIDDAFLAGKQENLDKEAAMEKESRSKISEAKLRQQTDDAIRAREQQIAQQESDMEFIAASEEEKRLALINNQIATQEAILLNATDSQTKLAALNETYRLNELKKEELAAQARIKNQQSTFATIATLQNSNNQTLAGIGKAAAITQIAIATPVAISKALAAFPPPFNFAAAGLVGAAMAAQAAQIAGVPLAEGGIVMPRPGGTQAIIGEAGQAEAVIPLDRAGEFGMGGGSNVTINVYGGLLGDEASARELAKAFDREMLKLRQNNESVSFDSGVV